MNKKNSKPAKRKKRRGIVTVLDLEDLHKIINKVQINSKEIPFVVADMTFIPTIQNIVKDSSLSIKKKKYYKKEIYVLVPSKTEFLKEANVDEFEKELFTDQVAEEE